MSFWTFINQICDFRNDIDNWQWCRHHYHRLCGKCVRHTRLNYIYVLRQWKQLIIMHTFS